MPGMFVIEKPAVIKMMEELSKLSSNPIEGLILLSVVNGMILAFFKDEGLDGQTLADIRARMNDITANFMNDPTFLSEDGSQRSFTVTNDAVSEGPHDFFSAMKGPRP